MCVYPGRAGIGTPARSIMRYVNDGCMKGR